MTTEVLGSLDLLEVPQVNGIPVLLNAGGVPAILSGDTASRPAAGSGEVGRIYLDTTLNKFFRDDGSEWIDLTAVPVINGTANQIAVTAGTNVTPTVIALADNPQIPGTGRLRLPVGTTAQRPASPVNGDTRFNSDLDRAEIYSGSAWVPFGRALQVVIGTIPAVSGTSQIPLDSTLPQSGEGFQIWSQAFTPLSPDSTIIVEYTLTVSHGTTTRVIITSLFSGGTSAIATAACSTAGANTPMSLSMHHAFQPGSTATINFSARAGASANGTCFINSAGANTLGGTLVSRYRITEII